MINQIKLNNLGGKMSSKQKYVYHKKDFCIPVTKAEPLPQIQFIIDDFVKKNVNFCVDGDEDQWEIWRMVEENDSEKIQKPGMPSNPKLLYIDGVKVEDFELADE